jgi:citrate synthase
VDINLSLQSQLPEGIISNLKNQKKNAHPMDVLQSMIPMLAAFDEKARLETKAANIKKSICGKFHFYAKWRNP